MQTNSPTLGFLLHEVARLLRRRFEQNAKNSGLTRSQWQVLSYLSHNEGINQTKLADLLDIEPITLGRIADKLQAAGLLERTTDPSDRRVWLLRSTASAKPKLEQVRRLGDLTRGEALEGISDTDRERLVEILQSLKINLTEACSLPASELKSARHD